MNKLSVKNAVLLDMYDMILENQETFKTHWLVGPGIWTKELSETTS